MRPRILRALVLRVVLAEPRLGLVGHSLPWSWFGRSQGKRILVPGRLLGSMGSERSPHFAASQTRPAWTRFLSTRGSNTATTWRTGSETLRPLWSFRLTQTVLIAVVERVYRSD